MADGKVTTPTDPLAGLAALAQTLMGSKQTQTTSPGDVSGLQSALAQLQAADYTQMLQSIFQQAQGAIPGIQRGMTSTIGARSGNNSAVAAAMQKLLQDTTVAAQKQMADQMLANQQAQVQAGNAIAQATRGTSQTTQRAGALGSAGTALGTGLTGYAGLQALAKMLGKDKVSDLLPNMGMTAGATLASPSIPSYTTGANEYVSPLTSAPAPVISVGGAASPDLGTALYDLPAGYDFTPSAGFSLIPSFDMGDTGMSDQAIFDAAMEVPPIDYGADLNYEDWQNWF